MWPRSERDQAEAAEKWEFSLSPTNPVIRGMIRFFWGIGLLGLVIVWVLCVVGIFDIVDAVMMSFFLMAFPAIMMWRFRQQAKGTVEVTRGGIFIWGSGGRRGYNYEWKDIAEVRVSSPSGRWAVDRLLAPVTGAGEDVPFVEIRLTRPQLPIIPDRWGTLWAIRGLGPKTVRLYVTDPEGLVRATQAFLSRPLDAGRL